ncbi:MAG: hypothetical protein KDC44_22670, partial [Phaeodactylibacter sp.]|nr:hypothetical protein [Phaeodactylibacter sp.]
MQFSCTKKVVDKLKGIRSVAKEKWDAGFYNWYIDLVRIERKTYFLYTHSTTLFSFFVKAGPKTTLKSMETSFFEKMKEVVLQEIGANAAYVELLMAERASFEYGLTNSRAIL